MAAQPQAPPLGPAERRLPAPAGGGGTAGLGSPAADEEMVSAQITEGPKAIGYRILPTMHSPVVCKSRLHLLRKQARLLHFPYVPAVPI